MSIIFVRRSIATSLQGNIFGLMFDEFRQRIVNMVYHAIRYVNGLGPHIIAQQVLEATKHHHLVHIRDVPFEGEKLHTFYDEVTRNVGNCLELGETVGSIAVGERWTYVCYDPTIENAYRSSANAQPLHTDGAYQLESPDATCMYCISNTSIGGETVFIPGEQLIKILRDENPELLDLLCTTPVCFSRTFVNGENKKERRIIEQDEQGNITLTWNYYRVDPDSSSEIKKMCESFHQYLQQNIMGTDKLMALHLEPGEAVLWLDEKLLHGRNSFVAHKYGDRNLAKTCLKIVRA
jgi:alpha-ketoglutarate-dependent taurine dioxygenase